MKHKLMWLLFNKEASAAVADAYDFCARILAQPYTDPVDTIDIARTIFEDRAREYRENDTI